MRASNASTILRFLRALTGSLMPLFLFQLYRVGSVSGKPEEVRKTEICEHIAYRAHLTKWFILCKVASSQVTFFFNCIYNSLFHPPRLHNGWVGISIISNGHYGKKLCYTVALLTFMTLAFHSSAFWDLLIQKIQTHTRALKVTVTSPHF